MTSRTWTRTLATLALLFVALIVFSPRTRAQEFPRTQTVTAATYSEANRADVYAVDASSNAVAFTLRPPNSVRRVVVVKTDTSTNAVTITTAGTGATINGSTNYVLKSMNDSVTLVSNGKTGSSGVWRVTATAKRVTLSTADKTVATTGNTDFYMLAPESGTLVGVAFSGADALAANDTNYITFSITNLGQAGSGSTVMLAATAANTTKTTGGTALAAGTKRALTLTGTAADLVVAVGDRLRIRAAATGTLAGTVTFSLFNLHFAPK